MDFLIQNDTNKYDFFTVLAGHIIAVSLVPPSMAMTKSSVVNTRSMLREKRGPIAEEQWHN